MACCLVALSISVGCRVRRLGEGSGASEPNPASSPEKPIRAESVPDPQGKEAQGRGSQLGGADVGAPAAEARETNAPQEDEGRQSEQANPEVGEEGLAAQERAGEGSEPSEESRRPLREGWRVLAFAGGAAFPRNFDEFVLKSVETSSSPAEAAVQIAAPLEAAPATNAGVGSALRLDGTTIECDALVMDSEGRKALVGGLRSAKSPVSVAAALYRAGGATVRGAAADELARRLGAGDGELLTQDAEAAYLGDLRLHAGAAPGGGPGSLESLYVAPEKLSQALASAAPGRENKLARMPIFVVVTDGTTSVVAASSGGIVLSHPGAPSLLDAPHSSLMLNEEGAVFVAATHRSCPDGALLSSAQLRLTRSSLLAATYLSVNCPDVPHVVLSGKTLRTNVPTEMLYVRGEGLENERPEAHPPSSQLSQDSLGQSNPKAPPPAVTAATAKVPTAKASNTNPGTQPSPAPPPPARPKSSPSPAPAPAAAAAETRPSK